ncbi:hypothetical protein PENSPDRAFT_213922 [Peniophora sp. CONT]|nr:hypothetical protein PENSPDRAFT_213922 [Peniophora sp. CONT]
MRDIGPVLCNLVEGWVVGPLFGNVALFMIVANALHVRWRESTSARWLLIVSILQLAISTGHVVVLLVRTIDAFVYKDGAAREAFLSDERTPLHTAEQALYTFNDIIAGGILTWRCFVVWNYDFKPCIILIASCIGTAVSGIGSIVRLTTLPSNQTTFFESSLKAWLTAFWVQSVVTQTVATGLIAWKIWTSISWRSKAVGTREWHALLVFVESGALYSIGTILVLAFYLRSSNIGTIVAGMLGQLSATAPYLIIVRSEARRAATVVTASKAATEYALRDLPLSPRQAHFWKMSAVLLGGSLSKAGHDMAMARNQEQRWTFEDGLA